MANKRGKIRKKPQRLKVRRVWTRKPVQKVKPSGKLYSRKKGQKELAEDLGDEQGC